tara:strand:+ start:9482 stop:10135 length:654 start_codon:yes stop_codon:yes gene_type:complete
MSIDPIKFAISDNESHEGKWRQRRLKRSTYTVKNALKFQAYFDLSIRDKKSVLIPVGPYNVKLDTLYKKVADGLLWLVQNMQQGVAQQAYALLKSQSQFVKVEGPSGGVKIVWDIHEGTLAAESIKSVTGVAPVGILQSATTQEQMSDSVADIKQAGLVERIVSHLQNESDTGIFHEDGLNLTPEKVREVAEILTNAGVPQALAVIEPTQVRFFKPS